MSEVSLAIPEQTAIALNANVEALGRYVMQMAHVVSRMQARLDELEENQSAKTYSHDDVKDLNRMIRESAFNFCVKYAIGTDCEKMVRAAIKKDLLKKFSVKDFHDLPVSAMTAVTGFLDRYANIKLAMTLKARND